MTDVPAAQPAELTITLRQRRLVLFGVLVGMLVAAINQTTVTTVLPTIAAELHGLDLYTWVFTASMLASAVATPIFGKLSDGFGRRRLFIIGVSVFLIGALACAMAGTMHQLIAARAVQGIGMGAIMPLAMAIIADIIPASDRGKWQGVLGAVFGLATVLGPLAGGWVSDHFGWRWIFWANLPLGALALLVIVTQLHLPFHRREAKIDWLGALTFAGLLVSLLLALSQGGTQYAWSSTHILGLFAVSALCLAAFIPIEMRASDPLIPLRLLGNRNVLATSIAGLAVGAGMFTGIFYVPLFMQAVVGVSSADSGLALVPLMFGLILSSTISGIVITRTGTYKLIMVMGPVIAAIGLWLMSQLDASTSVPDAAWRMMIVGAGIGLALQNLVLVAQNSVDVRHTGVVTSLATLTRSMGGTLGIALLGTVFANTLADNIRAELRPLGAAASTVAEGKLDAQHVLGAHTSMLPAPVVEAVRTGVSDTLTHLFLLGVPFMAVALVACLALRREQLSDTAAIRVVDELEHELADLVPIDSGHASAMPESRDRG